MALMQVSEDFAVISLKAINKPWTGEWHCKTTFLGLIQQKLATGVSVAPALQCRRQSSPEYRRRFSVKALFYITTMEDLGPSRTRKARELGELGRTAQQYLSLRPVYRATEKRHFKRTQIAWLARRSDIWPTGVDHHIGRSAAYNTA